MSNAARMVDDCFRHQHPEAFGRPEVLPEFPREATVASEVVPDGMNREGYVREEYVTYTGADQSAAATDDVAGWA